jgi:alkaline phosphatase
MKASKAARLWGFFGMNGSTALGYDMDRDPALVPSLSEMTEKAISTLSANKKGFVLMVEGSLIDWAAHANDPVGVVGDINAFDRAVAVAVDFAKKDKNTVVIVVTDHGNSGISIGNASTSSGYDTLKLSTVVDPLKKATRTAQGVADLINAERSNIAEAVAQYYGLAVSDDDIAKIKAAKDANDLRYVCQAVLGAKMAAAAKIGFTTGGHTGEDIVLYVYSPKASERPMGVVMNTDIARYMEKLLGTDLRALTAKQFQLAPSAFASKGAAVRFDFSDKANPVLVVTKGATKLKFMQNKSIAIVSGRETKLSGIVLYTGLAGGENWYVPQDAIDLVN